MISRKLIGQGQHTIGGPPAALLATLRVNVLPMPRSMASTRINSIEE
jgi:hypothetical protein